ncbi:MAG: NAD(P)-dependent oxidoreductase [Butyrivibrio sp.]|uniref:NAD-dependent epimerase/dehydratase family protein n=1 Tax=Butyrivibrio sp. TaxID=28121 RepID=UPI0025F6C478|nr:NAD(P)-dependent oxidoreductase [Butyrivibrio sp.]MCR5770694.1 NAD(P)-dependent oxidoreductase [Butyrivibrio sp.]
MMKNAIVTGATGFIGSWLALELLNAGWGVTIIVRDVNKILPEILDNVNCLVIQGDLNTMKMEKIPSRAYDVFFNLCWSGVSPEKKDDIGLQISNITMALNALTLCKEVGCKLFISTGTVAEYAMTTNVMDLGAKQQPNDMYGAAKVSTHYFLDVQSRKLKQSFIWCVIPSTFGERRIDNNIITYTIRSLLKKEIPSYGKLEQMWDFLYVSDVVRALRMIGERGICGKVYGIGSGQYKPLFEYIKTIRDIINPELKLGIGERIDLSEKAFSSCVNIYDLIRDTGFKPCVSFEEGIRNTIRYWEKEML